MAKHFAWLCLLWVWCAATPLPAQTVVINEIMYHPPTTNLLEEWFEIYNPGTNAVDLSGWQVTKGVEFTFPTNTVIGVGGYLVVAADRATFTNHYPTVSNFVAGWIGDLGHSLELSDNLGQVVNSIEFFNDGDWAPLILGLNGVVGAVDPFGGLGWESFALHDGYGASLELINPKLPNTYAHNWGANRSTNSTPGRVNSIATNNVAPFIAEVGHIPIIPQPTDPVTIVARIVDEHTNGLSVALRWRLDGAASFTTNSMFDDGAHGDGLANDGIYGIILPAQANATIVEFSVQARDLEGLVRVYPNFTPGASTRTANLLYQVDNGTYSGAQPVYRMIMTEAERAYLQAYSDNSASVTATTDSDANMNATWITTDGVVTGGVTTQLRYNVGVRNRGHGSRTANPHNFHVNIPSDRLWKKVSGINLNSQYAHSQLLGSAIFRRTEMPMADSAAVQARVNGANQMVTIGTDSFGSYAANEQYNNDFVKRSFPLDSHGNSYRGIRNQDAHTAGVADLTWQGANYAVAGYTNAYYKQNNTVQNDWSDLINMIGVLNLIPGYSSQGTYAADVQRVINVEEWMKYMAVNTLMDNQETCLANGIGDDYALYRGTNDTRFLALSYDMDTIMGVGTGGQAGFNVNDPIFRMLPSVNPNAVMPVLYNFMTNASFAPIYYKQLKSLCDTTFAPAQMNILVDQLLNSFVPQGTIDTIKNFNSSRVSYVLSQIPLSVTVTSSLPVVSGYPHTTVSTVALGGFANAIDTRRVLVNGATAAWTAWQGMWSIGSVTLRPGVNRVIVTSLNSNNVEFARTNIDIWYEVTPTTTVNGTLAANTVWTAAGGPYNISGNLVVPAGVTLTIQPGASVYVAAGATITVNGTGKILAQGNDTQRVHIGRSPAAGNWGSLDFINTTVESRLAYVDFDSCGGTTATDGHNAQIHVINAIVFIDHCTWPPTPVIEYISFNGASFIVQNCFFPSYPPPTGPESLHGINGIMAGGYGILRDNYFGHTWGFNDTIDFTGGQRQGAGAGPILQVINCIFDGASDDCLDLDSTDAWIEGNIFMHVHRDPTRTDDSRDTGSAISGGVDFANQYSDWTLVNNLFFDVDHVFLNKSQQSGGGRVAMFYNTVVHVNKEYSGSPLSDIGAFDWADDGTTPAPATVGSGLYAAHNIIYDCAVLNVNYFPANYTVIMDNNILSVPWAGAGSGNQVIDPHLNLAAIAGIAFTNVTPAQARLACQLLPGSPASGAGFGGRDIGGLNPFGIAIAGDPVGTTASTSATLTVGLGGTFNWGTWPPQGWGWTAYKWKLDNGAFSAEIPVTNNLPFTTLPTITVSNLSNGPHTVFVTGKNDAGSYQDDPFVYTPTSGVPAHVTASRTWTVNTSFASLLINEVLAKNSTVLTNGTSTPDLVELYNAGGSTIDLSGMGLTSSTNNPYTFSFPPGATLAGGAFLVLYADSDLLSPGIHLGFALKQSGDDLFLYASTNVGGALLDSISFGIQLADLSIGRLPNGTWSLCKPTFGAANVVQPTGNPALLKINEWLTDAQFLASHDFVELYNPDVYPVPLGGLFFSDAAGAPNRNPIPALSFIAAQGFTSFVADGDSGQGADHLNFKLSPDVGIIILSDSNLNTIDIINYGPQHTDVSQGRSPSGGNTLVNFAQPTPGAGNPAPGGGVTSVTNITAVSVPLLTIMNTAWRWDSSGSNYATTWLQDSFNDSAWSNGFGLFGFESTPNEYLPNTFQTYIPPPDSNGVITVYYRTRFNWTNSLANVSLVATNYIDDGAVWYLNGSEVGRVRVAAGQTYTTLAANQPTEGQAEVMNFSTASLKSGTNLMEVEVHQTTCCGAGTSSDDVFGMSLSAVTYTTNIISSGATNIPVVLNEVLANNQTITNSNGTTSDWVELYNPSTNTVDLTDVSLSNDSNDPRKWVFPIGTTLASHAYKVIYFDNNSPLSGTNTGFSLKANGDAVFLFDKLANGGALVDAISFGLQAPDRSIGRIPNGTGTWVLNTPTRGLANTAAGTAPTSGLRINEWMADPVSGSDWFEIYNTNSAPVPLGGLFLTDDLTDKTQSPIQPLSFIGGNAFVQIFADGNVGSGADHVSFSLKKSGEAVGIFSPTGLMLDGVPFGGQATGVSQGRLPDGSANIVSFASTPSPAESNYLPLTNAVVNEVLTHTDPPLEDAIELFNLSGATVNLGGWFLSNTKDSLKKYRIPDNTMLPGNGFGVLYEYQFNDPNSPSAFTLNSAHGDQVNLSAADAQGNLTGFRAKVKFGAAENGVSFGRYQTSVGVDFTALNAHTFGVDNPADVTQFRTGTGLSNALPKVGPIVISEIMYHPNSGGLENPDEEFIELANITGSPVPLYDPNYPTNTWTLTGAVSFTFPTNKTLAANGSILLVDFAPASSPIEVAAFRSKYNVSTNIPIFGPWSGRLDNKGDSIELNKPDAVQLPPHPDAGFVPAVLVDRIAYKPAAPWPAGANGTSNSLQRINAAAYGNDPVNWLAAAPTAGSPTVIGFVDTDGDGMDDNWELQYFQTLARDGSGDFDGDGMTDLQEYLAGTDPTVAGSNLRLTAVAYTGANFSLSFIGVAGKTYRVEYSTTLLPGSWIMLMDFQPQSSGPVPVPDNNLMGNPARFYRVKTPAGP